MREKSSTEKRVAAGFVFALMVLVLVTAGASWNATRFAAAFRSVDHTHKVLYNLERTLTEVLNVQSGSRGYVLMGEQHQLQAYEQGITASAESIRELRQLTSDHPLQQQRLDALEMELGRFLAITKERHTARREGGLPAAIQSLNLQAGQIIHDRITGFIREMEAEERALLDKRSQDFQAASRTTVIVMLFGGILAISLVAVAGSRVRKDFLYRRRAERELEDFFQLARDPMAVLSPDGRILRLNAAWETILGYAVEDLKGSAFVDLAHPEDMVSTGRHLSALVEGSETVGFEARYMTSDGQWRWLQWNAIPSQANDAIYAAARDITDHKRAMEALKKSAEEVRDLYNLAPCGYHSLDANGRFISINDTELNWLGYTREEVIGELGFIDLLTPSGQALFRDNFPRFKADGVISDLEFELTRKDGTTFPVSLSATAIRDASGGYLASRTTLFDITERRQTDRQIRRLNLDLQLQNARLEIANKELESFSYSVSHDLRAPLRHIDGFASLLARHASLALDEKGQRLIGVISDSAKRMGRLIDDLLTFSRMGRTEMEETDVDHNQLVQSVIRDSRFAEEKKVEWHIQPLLHTPGDAAMLRQVWHNLLDNAVKYSAHAKPPRIEVGSRRDPADPTDITFYIKDNGVGFDMKYAVKLFGVFQRLHAETEFEGTGIGLANVRRIVMRHGGRTWAESTVGGGSTFSFSLPTNPAART